MVSNMCNDNRRVLILKHQGIESDQIGKAYDKFLNTLKRPLERREPAELNPEMLSSFDAKGPHVQASSVEVDEEAMWKEQSSVIDGVETLLVRELAM